jgi:predicted  nucleic acid-binding Zn-ribbon protein
MGMNDFTTVCKSCGHYGNHHLVRPRTLGGCDECGCKQYEWLKDRHFLTAWKGWTEERKAWWGKADWFRERYKDEVVG